MLYPSINEIRKKADSRYTLVIMASKRARDIIDGKPVLTDFDINKPVSLATHEIAEDLITYKRNEAVVEDEAEAEENEEIENAEEAVEAEIEE